MRLSPLSHVAEECDGGLLAHAEFRQSRNTLVMLSALVGVLNEHDRDQVIVGIDPSPDPEGSAMPVGPRCCSRRVNIIPCSYSID
jgi:hypothetical protein